MLIDSSRYSANTPFGFFPQALPRDENIYESGFDASWELDVFGGIRRGVQASQAELAASIEDSRDVRVTLLAEAARGYVAVRALERRLQIARANLHDQNDSLNLAQARFEQGFAPELDVFQARSLLETTQAQVPELESELAQTVHSIGVLLGREPDALEAQLSDTEPIPGIADPDAIAVRIPAGMPSDLLRRRPDIRSAESNIAAATARVGVATADDRELGIQVVGECTSRTRRRWDKARRGSSPGRRALRRILAIAIFSSRLLESACPISSSRIGSLKARYHCARPLLASSLAWDSVTSLTPSQCAGIRMAGGL